MTEETCLLRINNNKKYVSTQYIKKKKNIDTGTQMNCLTALNRFV